MLLGNHRDAWVFGAADPTSGTAVMMEVSRVLAKLVTEEGASIFFTNPNSLPTNSYPSIVDSANETAIMVMKVTTVWPITSGQIIIVQLISAIDAAVRFLHYCLSAAMSFSVIRCLPDVFPNLATPEEQV